MDEDSAGRVMEGLSDAFGRCLCCGEPCTTGGCSNPSCSRCQRNFYPSVRHFKYTLQPDGTYKLEPVDVILSVEPQAGRVQPDGTTEGP